LYEVHGGEGGGTMEDLGKQEERSVSTSQKQQFLLIEAQKEDKRTLEY